MRLALSIMVAVAPLAASPSQARTCALSAQDIASVGGSVRAFFNALEKDDRAAYQRAVTADFWTFDAGRRMNATELFDLVEGAHKAGRVINWSIGPIAVRGDCDLAWAAWENDGSAGVPPKMAPRRWLESAVLRRAKGGWRVEFLHSSSVPPAGAKPPGQ
jgi:hypothetical protein